MTREHIISMIMSATGASAVGMSRICPVPEETGTLYRQWIADGCHADMDYLEKYGDVRDNPALLLEGASSIITAAFSFANPDAMERMRSSGNPIVSEYALGRDYHKEVRSRLRRAATLLTKEAGGETRICVDTAPLRERYWAARSGIGFIGLNNYLIIPGAGAHFFLGEILWTGEPSDGFEEQSATTSRSCVASCDRCMACVRACPTGALSRDGRLDARKCLSYLTIESRDPLPHGILPGKRLFGCDTCRKACPHQPAHPPVTEIEAFRPRKDVVSLTAGQWDSMTESEFETLFQGSAVRRTTLSHLKDVLARIKNSEGRGTRS